MSHPFIIYSILSVFSVFYLRQMYYCSRIEDDLKHDTYLWDYFKRANSGRVAVDFYSTSTDIIPMNRVYHPIYPVAPSHSLSACVIPKNMSTLLTAILCLLFNPSKWSSTGRNLTLDTDRPCRNSNELHRISQLKKLARNGDKWTNLMLVREPAERFLSGFLFMCGQDGAFPGRCFNCDEDVICVLRQLYALSRRFSRGDITAEGHELWHLGPQNWHCEYFSDPEEYKIIRYSPAKKEDLARELSTVLLGSRVDSVLVEMITSEILTKSTPHTTHKQSNETRRQKVLEQLESREGKELMRNIFFWDYVLFGFPLPS